MADRGQLPARSRRRPGRSATGPRAGGRRHPRADGRRRPRPAGPRPSSTCARRCGPGAARSPTSTGPPARSPPTCAARGRRAGRRRRASSCPTGSRPASRSGPPPTSARWSCRSCTSTGPRRSTTSSGPPSPTSSSPPTASASPTTWRRGRTLLGRPPRAAVARGRRHAGGRPARRAPTPFAALLDGDPIAGPAPVDPDAPALIGFTSGTTRDPKGVDPLAPHDRLRDPPARPHVPAGRAAPDHRRAGRPLHRDAQRLPRAAAARARRSTWSTCGTRARSCA